MTQFDVIDPVIDVIATTPKMAQVYTFPGLAIFGEGG